MSRDNKIEKLFNNGYDLKEILGREKARRKAGELNNIIGGSRENLNKFVEKAIELHMKLNIEIPYEILDAKDDVSLAQSFVMGMIGSERIEKVVD